MKYKFPLGALLALLLLLSACAPKTPPATEVRPTALAATQPAIDPYAGSPTGVLSSDAVVKVSDQDLSEGTATIAKVTAAVDGWIVIHVEADGKPGPVIGYAQVSAGESTDVKVTIDASQATPKLFAMLHVDEGTKGTYEFPGADAPVKNGDTIVMQAFNSVVEKTTPADSVVAMEQSIANGTVTIAAAYMNEPGWLVIHAETDGNPGPVIGYVALPVGESTDIQVAIDESKATPRLFAMLHIDAGTLGTYEFPGDDLPVKLGDMIVMIRFDIK